MTDICLYIKDGKITLIINDMVEAVAAIKEVVVESAKEAAKEVGRKAASEVSSKGLEKTSANLEKEALDKGNKIDSSKVNLDSSVEKKGCLYDDNGKVYSVEGNLTPNNTYELKGYEYQTDGQGRIISGEGEVKESTGPRTKLPYLKDALPTDQKGHVIAHEFGGADTRGNLVPMDGELNQNGDFRNFEREIKSFKGQGNDVHMKVELHYDGDSHRPSKFTCSYEVNGEYYEKNFLNK